MMTLTVYGRKFLRLGFDRGLVSISNDYKIIISNHITENENHAYSLKQLEGRRSDYLLANGIILHDRIWNGTGGTFLKINNKENLYVTLIVLVCNEYESELR